MKEATNCNDDILSYVIKAGARKIENVIITDMGHQREVYWLMPEFIETTFDDDRKYYSILELYNTLLIRIPILKNAMKGYDVCKNP